MKDTNAKVDNLKGVHENYPQPIETLQELVNWQVDQYTGGWSNRLGYERYDSTANDFDPFLINRVDSMFYVQRHQGAQDSILFEQNGFLYQLNDFDGVLKKNVLSEGRTLPRSSEIGTQFCQFGRYIIYANGYDRPSKSRLWPITDYSTSNYLVEYPLGFDAAPSAPVAWGVLKTASSPGKNEISIEFSEEQNKGMGILTAAAPNMYKYKVTFVNTAGAESPFSSSSNVSQWDSSGGSTQSRYAIGVEIPVGNNDVIARRIYRTKNFSSSGGADGDTYYFVAEIPNNGDDFFIDDIPDTGLGSQADSELESIPFPAIGCRYLGSYKDCLFIDGGRDDDLTLFYSHPAKPDQFAALNFITLSHREGGGLTGLFSYFNNLLAFRDHSIDIIRGTYPNFNATNLVRYIGTRATNTIVGVEGLGVLFLSYDGIYSININLDYNDHPNVQNVTPHLRDTFERINKDAICKASAVYSKKRREYIVHFPVDGSPVNNMGLVYHTDKLAWSIRENIPAGPLIVTSTGDVMFGMNDGSVSPNNEHGIMVLSRKRAAGATITEDTMTDNPPLTSIMRSAWLDMGDPSTKKKIHSVYLFIATGGDQDISLSYYMDFNYNSQELTEALRQQRPDFEDQVVYDKVILNSGAYWEEPLVTTIRYDVHSAACSHFQWKIETNADVHVIGYAIDFTGNGMRVIQGKKL
tara:strand:- start:212 stop:2287 length:2076 start_codon:yes stop_codon:yes gene_type:complete